MSSPPSMLSRVFAGILSAVALFVWLQTVVLLSNLTGSDAAGNGMAQGFAFIGIILLWLTLIVLAVIAHAKGTMPRWTGLAALVLIPASAIASGLALELLTRPGLAPHYWPILIPAIAPLLVIVFCFWALFPSLQKALPAPLAGGLIWGAMLGVTIAIVPMQMIRAHVLSEREEIRARFDAELRAVPADAPLWALTPFLGKGNYVQNDEVIRRIRTLPRRQVEAETMLARGDFPLAYLGQIDLKPTAVVCEKSRALLRERVKPLVLATPNSKAYRDIAAEVQGAIAAMRWLIGYDCPATEEAQAWQTMAEAYRDTNYDIYELRDLRDPKALGRTLYEDPDDFSLLRPRSHLKAWLKFADDRNLRERAIAGAATLDHRNADAAEILLEDDFTARLLTENIARLDLHATPEICRFALDGIRVQLSAVYLPRPDDPRSYRELLGRLGRGDQFNALIWLASNGCDARRELAAAISLINAYQPSSESGLMLGRLESLQKK